MDQLLTQRLDILMGAGEINQDINTAVKQFAKNLEEKYSLTMTEENSSMLITHLAMALARIVKGEEINKMEEFLLNEVKQNKVYGELPEFYEKIQQTLEIEIPESEKGFIALHVCTLISNIKN